MIYHKETLKKLYLNSLIITLRFGKNIFSKKLILHLYEALMLKNLSA